MPWQVPATNVMILAFADIRVTWIMIEFVVRAAIFGLFLDFEEILTDESLSIKSDVNIFDAGEKW